MRGYQGTFFDLGSRGSGRAGPSSVSMYMQEHRGAWSLKISKKFTLPERYRYMENHKKKADEFAKSFLIEERAHGSARRGRVVIAPPI